MCHPVSGCCVGGPLRAPLEDEGVQPNANLPNSPRWA
jgi:hypothetical protein